jgi:hypothetical protein
MCNNSLNCEEEREEEVGGEEGRTEPLGAAVKLYSCVTLSGKMKVRNVLEYMRS